MSMRIKIEGIEEAMKALDNISKDIKRKPILDRAMKKAMKPILAQAKEDAPENDGELVKSIKAKSARIRNKRTTSGAIQVGVYAPHAWLVQNGSGPRTKTSTGQYVGIMPPNFFFAIAMEQHKEAAVKSIGNSILAEVDKAVKKHMRK